MVVLQKEKNHHLSRQHAEEHGQWVNGGICHGSAVVNRGLGGSVRQCRRVGSAACKQAHYGEIVEFEPKVYYLKVKENIEKQTKRLHN